MLNLSSNNVNLFEKGTGGQSTPGGVLPVRVVDILLDDTHPEWDKYGKMEALGAIKYRVIGEFGDESDPTLLDVAYPMNFNFKAYPLLNLFGSPASSSTFKVIFWSLPYFKYEVRSKEKGIYPP